MHYLHFVQLSIKTCKQEQVLFIMTGHRITWEIKFIRLFLLPLACYLFQDSPMTHIMLNSGDSWHLIITTLVMPSAPGICCCLLRVGGKSKDTALAMSSEKIPWVMYDLTVPHSASSTEHKHRTRSNSCYQHLPAAPTLFTRCNMKDIYLLCTHLSGNQLNCILFKCLHSLQSGWNNLL